MARPLFLLVGSVMVAAAFCAGTCFGETADQSPNCDCTGEPASSAAAPESGGNLFGWHWDNGPVMTSADGNFSLRITGRLQYDFGSIDQSSRNKAVFGDIRNDDEMRRLRLGVTGYVFKNVIFKFEPDFATGETQVKDAWIGLRNIPFIGTIRFGNQFEPMGLERLTSDNVNTFAEYAMAIEAFSPDRNVGLMANNTLFNKRMTWALGVFEDTDDTLNMNTDGFAVTGRVTAVPWITEQKDKLLHLGVSASYRQPPDNKYSFSARPEWHMGPKFLNTGTFAADEIGLWGLEGALVLGAFDVQAEAMGASTHQGNVWGWYVQAGYWLTGEHRNYDPECGVFTRVSPKNNFNPLKGGWGAWQVAARYSSVDLDDEALAGGKVRNADLGVNWQLNPNMRVMLDYVHSMPKDEGRADMFLLRTQVDF